MPEMDKRELRRKMKRLRDAIPEEQRSKASAAICRMATELARPGQTVFSYAAFGSEVDTAALIEALWAKGCRVCLPLVQGDGRMQAAHWKGIAAEFLRRAEAKSCRPDRSTLRLCLGWRLTGSEIAWATAADITTGFWRRAARGGWRWRTRFSWSTACLPENGTRRWTQF